MTVSVGAGEGVKVFDSSGVNMNVGEEEGEGKSVSVGVPEGFDVVELVIVGVTGSLVEKNGVDVNGTQAVSIRRKIKTQKGFAMFPGFNPYSTGDDLNVEEFPFNS
ncbi:MAG: hypothetical protein GYA12_07475 [Chloroflexi bacterium]|nr:hypothetical protein [Chloroflexota bacterium]